MTSLHLFDLLVIAGYFLVLLGIGYWAARREKNVSADYFLASRDVGWFAVGASLFASNIGSEHLVGLAGTGAASGLAVGHFEWLACLILLLLGWLFVPFYLRSGVYTMPEFLEKRYNSAARSYFTWVSVIGYVLTKISVTLYAGGVVIGAVTGWNFTTAAIILIVVTGLYTIFGGLRAVVYTEVLQAIVLILGSATLMAIGLSEVGGFAGLEAKVPAGFFSMWKPIHDPDFPWTGIIFGAPILGIWYWCTDQHIVQRVLAAKNITEARTGTIFAGYLKILPVFIFVLPGIVAAALFADVHSNPDSAYPTLVTRLLPDGIKGLVLAGMLAALMSSLASAFNACSTLLTWDVYRKMRPTATEQQLVLVGRVSAGVMVFLGLVWIPFMKYISSQIYIYLQSVQAYIAPPIAACFLLGLFYRRLNGAGAVASLVTGLVLGVLRLVLELWNKAEGGTALAAGSLFHWIATINFLHYAVLLFVICTAVLFVVSMATPPPPAVKTAGLTYGAQEITAVPTAAGPRTRNIVLSVILACTIGVLWYVFR
ncbi:MAG TPA: sodium:solute symporter [Gemmatimonadales bacterium]|nr:sodium:solute symporter [Gemmatimonadales bacterium]